MMPAQGERAEVYKQYNNANTQFAIWLALTELKLGGSLQHISRELSLAEKDLDDLYNNERSAASAELVVLRHFVEENETY